VRGTYRVPRRWLPDVQALRIAGASGIPPIRACVAADRSRTSGPSRTKGLARDRGLTGQRTQSRSGRNAQCCVLEGGDQHEAPAVRLYLLAMSSTIYHSLGVSELDSGLPAGAGPLARPDDLTLQDVGARKRQRSAGLRNPGVCVHGDAVAPLRLAW